MALTISEEEFYNQIFQVEENNISPYQTIEIPLHDPKHLSKGYRRSIEICSGLNFLIDDYTLQEDLTVELADGTPGWQLELSFSLLGNNYTEKTPPGQNFFAAGWHSGKGGFFKWQAGSRILKFDIHLEVPFFQTLIADDIEQLPQQMLRVISVEGEPDYLHFAKTTSAMQNLINQILNCPYQGITKRLYLESKALELIALRLEQIKTDSYTNISSSLKPDDIDRIYGARDILIKNLDKPPSLMQLARMVGLNDCTLKKGFREVFGTTAFGYLYDYRLEKARYLLEAEGAKVTDVVQMVGFRDRSYFAAAFRKKFGVNPSIYLKNSA